MRIGVFTPWESVPLAVSADAHANPWISQQFMMACLLTGHTEQSVEHRTHAPMAQTTINDSFQGRTGQRDIQVLLEIEPKGSCFMEQIEGEIADVALHFPDGGCQCDVTVERDEDGTREIDIVHRSGDICDHCPGIVFQEYNLVPRFVERTTDHFVVRSYLPADHQLSELVADLREVSGSVRVLKILDIEQSDVDSGAVEVDLSVLTDKQREAIELATRRGYYDSPPQTSLASLAAEFDVSQSALSQRLSRAEGHVMRQLFDRDRDRS
jgi:predicted DNA binding protein